MSRWGGVIAWRDRCVRAFLGRDECDVIINYLCVCVGGGGGLVRSDKRVSL